MEKRIKFEENLILVFQTWRLKQWLFKWDAKLNLKYEEEYKAEQLILSISHHDAVLERKCMNGLRQSVLEGRLNLTRKAAFYLELKKKRVFKIWRNQLCSLKQRIAKVVCERKLAEKKRIFKKWVHTVKLRLLVCNLKSIVEKVDQDLMRNTYINLVQFLKEQRRITVACDYRKLFINFIQTNS